MRQTDILIKPILSEKANAQQESLRRYAFRVNRKANKLEIKKAIEDFYGVTVVDVNTAVAPGKNKARYTKAGFIQGTKSAYKKAFVTVAEGESIDLYANI
ncbi:MAG: 50S ribosomal protein L23 [Sphingobacteriia bacterium]|jgi:large subunit ribosomal protein L23|nr:MAG: 50S ribosomal protein L23 [Sphingobacteriia bacterium]